MLVERELRARIEAQTATGFRQRRRAAKTARRIAALPPSLFDAGAVIAAETGSWGAPPAEPVVIDLPVSAIRDVRTPVWVESEAVQVREPEPLALVAPVIEITPASAPTDPAEPDRETELAPTEATPNRVHRRRAPRIVHPWRMRRPSRADIAPVALPVEPDGGPAGDDVAPASVAEPEPEPVAMVRPEPIVIAAPEPVVVPEPEPIAVVPPPPVAVAEPEPEPLVEEPEPEPIVAAAPKPAPKPKPKPAPKRKPEPPRGAVDWQPSNSLWARQVFHKGNGRQQAVSWPRPYERPAVPDDLAREYIDAEVADPAGAD